MRLTVGVNVCTQYAQHATRQNRTLHVHKQTHRGVDIYGLHFLVLDVAVLAMRNKNNGLYRPTYEEQRQSRALNNDKCA